MTRIITRKHLRQGIVVLLLAAMAAGCGQLTDKDRIRIAKIGERHITRGDLFKLIREMPDKERPMIRHRGDLLRVLNQHIDSRIKLPLGRKLAEEGKINVPLELAREEFFRRQGDEERQLRTMWQMEVPPPGVVTPLMREYQLTPELLQLNKDMIEEGADKMLERLQGERALQYLAAQAFHEGRITLDEAEIEREYGFMQETLTSYEQISFIGIRFPASLPDAAARVAQVRKRLIEGETFEELVKEYAIKSREDGIDYLIASDIVNDPSLTRFRGFWDTASGAQKGDIVGPVYLPAYQQVREDADGNAEAVNMPDAYVLLAVQDHKPERVLTLEEARPLVIVPLLTAKMMRLLRGEHGVEVYEDKLPDPSQFQGHGPGF